MASLGCIEKIGNRAENHHDACAQKRHHRDHDDGDDGQDQGVLDEGLPPPAGGTPRQSGYEGSKTGSHWGRMSVVILKNTSTSFDNEKEMK
jgi:hypothetical protein